MNSQFSVGRDRARDLVARLCAAVGIDAGVRPGVGRFPRHWLLAGLAVLVLAACGGGGGGGGADPVAQPSLAITTQPADQSTTAGQSAVFRIAANGDVSVQWQRLGADGQWADIPGATQLELVISNPGEGMDGGQYRAQLKGRNGGVLTSSPVTLRVAATPIAPALAAQPVDVQLRVGQAPTFTVTATGTAVRYQWQSSLNGLDWQDVADATAETLTLPTAVIGDSGRLYRVRVSNALGSVTSRAVTLGVLPALQRPLFTAQPQDRGVQAGQGALFTATGSGEPAPTLQWETSVDGQTWTPVSGAVNSTLVLTAVTLADDGRRYRAVATNSEGSAVSGVARLSVSPVPVAPTFARQPQAATVTQAQPVAFEADATGSPTPTYQWQVSLDGGLNYTTINGATEARLSLATTTAADDGKLFRVVASNASGDLVSSPAQLTVQRAPQVTLQPLDVVSGVSDAAVTLTVAGNAAPAPTVQWQASRDDGASYQDIPGATLLAFTWSPTRADDRQLLRARFSNAAGVAYSQAARVRKARWTHVSPSFVGTRLNAVRWLDAQVAVAVGRQGAIVRTADAGASWQFVQEPMVDLPHYDQLAVVDARTVLATAAGGVMMRSEDAGVTWRAVAVPTTAGIAAISFRNASIGVMAEVQGGAFRTVDGGLTWTRMPSADPAAPFERLSGVALRGSLGMAMGSTGWFRSTDGGVSWQTLNLPSFYASSSLFVTFIDNQTLMVTGDRAERSTDGGLTWQPASTPLTGVRTPARFSRDGLTGIDVRGEVQTTDGGVTWTYRPLYTWFGDLDVSPNDLALGLGENGELQSSTDKGVTWSAPYGSQSLDGVELWGVEFPDNDGRGIAFGNVGHTLVLNETLDGGRTWRSMGQFASQAVTMPVTVFLDAQVGMATSSHGPLLRTTDGGRTWTRLPAYEATVWNNNGLALVDRDTAVMSGDGGLFLSTDGGNSWARTLSVPGFPSDLKPWQVSARGNVVLAPTISGALHRSADGGRTWQTGSFGGSWPAAVTWTSNATVFILEVHGALHRSDDAGQTWRRVHGDLDPNNVFSAIRFSADGQLGVLVSAGTVYRSGDGGQTWNRDLVRDVGWWQAVGFAGSRQPVVVGKYGGVAVGSGY